MIRALLVLTGLGLAPQVFAHGDLHGRIEAATLAIEAAPHDTSRYARRAELHRLHGEWHAALADYERAAELGGAVDAGRGAVLAELGRLPEARAALDRALVIAPESVDTLIRRARVRLRTGDPSTGDYDRAIALTERPRPDLYVERARAEHSLGRIDAALAGLDEGMRRLGPIASLASAALELERGAGRWEAALARLDAMLADAPRKETLLVERGELLVAAGRDEAARAAFAAARAVIEGLPDHLRATAAVRALEARLIRAL